MYTLAGGKLLICPSHLNIALIKKLSKSMVRLKLKIMATFFSDVFGSEQIWVSYSIFVETLLSPNVWQYTGTVEAGKCLYSERGPPSETCFTAQCSAVHSVYTCSVYMSQVGSNLRLSNYTPWDLAILTNHRRALSYVLCSDWSISHHHQPWNPDLNHSMLTTSFPNGNGRGKNNNS